MSETKPHVLKRVQVFGKRKTAIAVATVTKSPQCNIKINGIPVSLIMPQTLRAKVMEGSLDCWREEVRPPEDQRERPRRRSSCSGLCCPPGDSKGPCCL